MEIVNESEEDISYRRIFPSLQDLKEFPVLRPQLKGRSRL